MYTMEDYKEVLNELDINEEDLKIVNKLSLKERKQQVLDELKKENLDKKRLKYLLLLDNTNEKLLYKYLRTVKKNIILKIIPVYSDFMSISKIKDIETEKNGKSSLGYRNISFKTLFFQMLTAIKEDKMKDLNDKIGIMNLVSGKTRLNNQPFTLENLDAFYFHLCCLFKTPIENKKEGNKENFGDYLKNLRKYIGSLSEILEHYKQDNYDEEKKDLKKFLTIFFSIINIDHKNSSQFTKVPIVLKEFTDEGRNSMIFGEKMKICSIYGEDMAKEFIKLTEDKKIYCDVTFNYENDQIEIPEECYTYKYITLHNVFKRYENQIIGLMNKIYKSDLIKNLVKVIYKTEDENMKYFFEEDNFSEDFWKNNIIFVPFKIEKVSGFSYKETFFFFFPIYMKKHFDSEIKNEIFTIGAFIRVLLHETLGHLMISYIFYMFYANTFDIDNYETPRMESQMNELNKKNLCECVGKALAKIYLDNLNVENKNSNGKFKTNFDDSFKKSLSKKFESIIGQDYAEKLAQKLLMNKEKQISNIKDESNLSDLSKIIVDILTECISEELNNYINNLKYKQENYKESESGNFVEFLLFNDFNQYMTLKDCLFLLNEENYKDTNFFKFRNEYKNLIGKNNDIFLEELTKGQKIFIDLFENYNSIYNKTKDNNNDLSNQKNFRGNCGNELNKKFEAIECFHYKRDLSNYRINNDLYS